MITFSLMFAAPAAHIKRMLAEHVLYASQKDNTIKSLNTAIDGHKKVCVDLRNQNDAMQARINALVKENDEFCANIGNMSVEIQNLKYGYAAMMADRDIQSENVRKLEARLAESVAQYVQDQIGGVNPAAGHHLRVQGEKISKLTKLLAEEVAAHEQTKLNGGEGTVAGYRLKAQDEELSRLTKLLTAKTKEIESLRKHLADFEGEKSEGSVGTCSTAAYSSLFNDIHPIKPLGLTESISAPADRPCWNHYTAPMYRYHSGIVNCRCAIVPAIPGLDKPAPKSSMKIKVIAGCSIKGTDFSYEFNGTAEEIKKAMAELEISWN